jgi:hypothetical protein
MVKTVCNALDDRGIAFKYILRLLTVEQAQQLESHLAGCDDCAQELAEITHFFELLRKALNAKPAGFNALPAPEPAMAGLQQSSLDLDSDKLVTIFANCFAGFQKLCKNIAARIGPKVERTQIEQAAIEILLALPNQVSKIKEQ